MQHFGTEVRQFRGLREGDDLDAMPAGQDGRISRQHAVYIGPNLNLFRSNTRAHDGRCEIRPAAAECGGDALRGCADEAAHHDNAVLRKWRNHISQPLICFRKQRRGLRVAMVRNNDAACIHMRALHSEVRKRQRDDVARETLAIARDGVDRTRRQLAQHGQALGQFRQFLEMLVERAVEIGALR